MRFFSAEMKPRRERGFTLIEVLIAAVLFAFASSALVGVAVNTITALQTQDSVSNEDAENRFIWNQLRRINDRETLENGGVVPLPNDRFIEWEATHESTEIADLHRIRFTLRVDSSGEVRTDEWSIYRLAPWLSEPSERALLLSDKRRELEAAR